MCACSVMSNSLWPPDSSVYGIFQARILQWIAIFPNPRIEAMSSALAGRFFYHYSTREAPQVLNLVGSSWPDSLYLDLEIPTVSLLNTLRETGQVSCPKKCWRDRNSQGTNCTIFFSCTIFLPMYTLKLFCHKTILKIKNWPFSL